MTEQLTCEEASELAIVMYIPCGKPATRTLYSERDGRSYNMCQPHADHNLRRGMIDLGDCYEQEHQRDD